MESSTAENMPLVSIITPVYNVADYLKRCVDSILAQSYKNIQLILVDDGSDDSSREICEQYAALDKRVLALFKENGGVSSARNLGLENAAGTYIQFVDSDDFVEKCYTQTLVELMQGHGVELVACAYNEVIVQNEIITASKKNFIKEGVKSRNAFLTFPLNHSDFSQECTVHELANVWGKLFLASIIKENNLKFDERLNKYEDILFHIKYSGFMNKAYTHSEGLYNHCVYSDSNRFSLTQCAGVYNKRDIELCYEQLIELFALIDVDSICLSKLRDFFCSMRIGLFIRMCFPENNYSVLDIYKHNLNINDFAGMCYFLKSYKAPKGRSKGVPFFLKLRLIIPAICAAKVHITLSRFGKRLTR